MKDFIVITYFDPAFWIFEVGLNLNRHEERDSVKSWIRKELSLGLLIIAVRINFYFNIKRHH